MFEPKQKRAATERGPDRDEIVVSGLEKSYGSDEDELQVIDDVSFTVSEGDCVGLLGPNGAGKTTLLKMMLGLITPDEGAVYVDGTNVQNEPRAVFDRVSAMLEGARNAYWRLTVRENFRFFASLSGRSYADIRDRHEELLADFELADRADTPVKELSRGMKQKVSLAIALARDTDIVFLDEPTLGLDVKSSATLQRELLRLVDEEKKTFLVSSHNMDVIEEICDRVLILHEGRVIADDAITDLLDSFETQVYEFELESPVSDTFRALLTDRFDVENWRTGRDYTRFSVVASSEEFYALTDELESNECVLAGVNSETRDLERLFRSLTEDQ